MLKADWKQFTQDADGSSHPPTPEGRTTWGRQSTFCCCLLQFLTWNFVLKMLLSLDHVRNRSDCFTNSVLMNKEKEINAIIKMLFVYFGKLIDSCAVYHSRMISGLFILIHHVCSIGHKLKAIASNCDVFVTRCRLLLSRGYSFGWLSQIYNTL